MFVALLLTSCEISKDNVTINAEPDSVIEGSEFGVTALVELGNYLWYDTTTHIVYWWKGDIRGYSATTPSPYYAPNGLPYRYDPEKNIFEEIHFE